MLYPTKNDGSAMTPFYTNLGQNAGFRAGALKPPEGAVQRFVIFDSDLCHFFIPSSRPTAGVAAELTG